MDYNEYMQRLNYVRNYKQQLRQKERGLNARARALSSAPITSMSGGVQKLESELKKYLPESHMPGNIGGINRVAWQFWYNFDFDFGTNPVLTNLVSQTKEIQVSQEAIFILMAISRTSFNQESEDFPFTLEIKDRQSSRYMNDAAIPFQFFGNRGKPTILSTPFLIFPNAKLEIKMGNSLPDAVSETLTGDIKHQISLFGYRVRQEDADKVLSSVFGKL